MRKLALCTAALLAMTPLALSSQASAADLPMRTTAPVIVAPPAFTWTGFYVGLNAGFGWTNGGNVTIDDPILGPAVISTGSHSGFVGGGQLGYNWQVDQFVFGAEADIQYADLGNTQLGRLHRFGISSNSNGQYLGTVRLRAGYAMDRVLFYVTGGLAYGGLNIDGAPFLDEQRRVCAGCRRRIRLHQQLDRQDRGALRQSRQRHQVPDSAGRRPRLHVLRQERQWRRRRPRRHQLQVLICRISG